jgi:hypothetical protein
LRIGGGNAFEGLRSDGDGAADCFDYDCQKRALRDVSNCCWQMSRKHLLMQSCACVHDAELARRIGQQAAVTVRRASVGGNVADEFAALCEKALQSASRK